MCRYQQHCKWGESCSFKHTAVSNKLEEIQNLQEQIKKENDSLKKDINVLQEKVKKSEEKLKEEEEKVKCIEQTNSELKKKLDRVDNENNSVAQMNIKLKNLENKYRDDVSDLKNKLNEKDETIRILSLPKSIATKSLISSQSQTNLFQKIKSATYASLTLTSETTQEKETVEEDPFLQFEKLKFKCKKCPFRTNIEGQIRTHSCFRY